MSLNSPAKKHPKIVKQPTRDLIIVINEDLKNLQPNLAKRPQTQNQSRGTGASTPSDMRPMSCQTRVHPVVVMPKIPVGPNVLQKLEGQRR